MNGITHTTNDDGRQQFGDFLASRTEHVSPKQEGNALEAIAHLQTIDLHGWHNLVAMDADKPWLIEGRTFKPGAWSDIDAWIADRNGRLNLYFSVNEPKPTAGHKKLSDADMGAIR